MLSSGLRVVRGPNWCYGNQDSGEGFVGTVRDFNYPGTPPQTVIVHWDNGAQLNCRVGYGDKYDLRVIDNAQTGAKHRCTCNACDLTITGMRYHCICCHDYDLCYMCYHNDKHELLHSFKRFDTKDSIGVNLPPRLNARKCELKGVFKGAKVVRGFDWEWGNQDGGNSNIGIVVDIRDWESKTSRSIVNVKWLSGNTDVYRLGHKGYCDIQFVEPSSSGEYYPEHLPVLGQKDEEMEWNGILDAIDRQQILQLENEAPKVEEQVNKSRQEQESTLESCLGPVESMYASVIVDHNKRVCHRDPYSQPSTNSEALSLLYKFCSMPEIEDEEVKEMWEMVWFMAQLPHVVSCENVIIARYSHTKMLISQGRKFLENRYENCMSSTIGTRDNLHISNGLYPLVHNFVQLRFKGEYIGLLDGTVDDRPLWPMVYYCLRSGDLAAAIYCLRDSPQFPEIVSVLKLKLDDPSNTKINILEKNIRIAYQSDVRNCTDPFKRIIWAVLGCCNEISEAVRTADDYLWFKLSLARVDCTDNEGYIKYDELQSTLLEEQGESHFDAFNRPCLYFKLLILTAQFEAAIEFLFRSEKFKAHAVHMAIALNELNLLAIPQNINSPLISLNAADPKPARRLNIVLLIKSYVEKFKTRSLNATLNYYYLLKDFTDTQGKNLFHLYVTNLLVTTKEYVKIVGKFEQSSALGHHSRNFYRSNGLIDQFNMPDLYTTVVNEIRTQFIDKNEKWEDLVDFYNTVNDQERVLDFMCTMLSKLAHLKALPGSLRDQLQDKAARIAEQYSRTGYNANQCIYDSFIKANYLLTFFDQYREKQYSEALKTLTILQIAPLKLEEIRRVLYNIPMLNSDLVKVIPDVLLAAMTILTDQFMNIKKSSNANQQHLRWIWEQANALTNFAEQLPKEIIADTLNVLVKMEVSLYS